MSIRTCLYSLFLVLSTLTMATAQSYELGWSEINEPRSSTTKNYTLDWDSVHQHVDRAEAVAAAPAPAAPVARFQDRERVLASAPPQVQTKVVEQAQSKQKFNLELSTSQYYDVYAARYLKVAAVEVATYSKGSYPRQQLFENRGQWNTYPVYLNGLEEGDRFVVRVIWDDGSNRTIEKSVDRYLGHTIYVGEPDYLAYTAW